MGNTIPWPGRHDAGKIILKGVGTRERKMIDALIVEALNACGTPERAGGFGRPVSSFFPTPLDFFDNAALQRPDLVF
jgi:hypothetical protein